MLLTFLIYSSYTISNTMTRNKLLSTSKNILRDCNLLREWESKQILLGERHSIMCLFVFYCYNNRISTWGEAYLKSKEVGVGGRRISSMSARKYLRLETTDRKKNRRLMKCDYLSLEIEVFLNLRMVTETSWSKSQPRRFSDLRVLPAFSFLTLDDFS